MKQQGFTLVELMVTIAVLGILAALVVPAFQSTIGRNQLSAAINDMIAMVQYARTEAINQATVVSLCPGGADSGCDGREWTQGLIVYIDRDEDGDADTNTGNPDTEELLRITEPMAHSVRVPFAAVDQISWSGRGWLANPGLASASYDPGEALLQICSNKLPDTGDYGRLMYFWQSGNIERREGPIVCPE